MEEGDMLSAARFRLAIPCLSALLVLISARHAHAQSADTTPAAIESVDFERHVMGLFGRMGCNAGSCHGSFQGKGGFRLSLFGYAPDKDYTAVTRDNFGRRINVADPDNSLLLLKASGQVEHGGGVRFARGSWQYQLLRRWITDGMPWTPGSGDVAAVNITPSELAFTKGNETQGLKVTARFADGSNADITSFCDFRTNDDAVADVASTGAVRSLRAGCTAVIVSYRGNVLPVRVLVPMELPAGFKYPDVPVSSYIDKEVFARLRVLNMVPSDQSSDAEFLRRVTIDTIGQLPTPDEVRAFLADTRAGKRARKIDELLAHPLHAALWATKLCDITGNDTLSLEQPVQLRAKRSQLWHEWFRKRIADNLPYDQVVHGVLCASSREGKTPNEWIEQVRKVDTALEKGFDGGEYASRDTLDLYWRRQQAVAIEQWGERTAAAFMGVRIECAQCHKHPFDRWSQADYRAYANIFGQVVFGQSPEAKPVIDEENKVRRSQAKNNNQQNIVREVFVSATPAKSLPHPDTNKALQPKALGGPVLEVTRGKDLREELFHWLHASDNPFFARSFVNRVWGHYLGVGIVHPVDDFSLANPPSNEKLLDALARDFTEHGYDIRHIERVILNSRTYQLSAKANETNRLDKNNYSRSYIRPMMAEAVVDVLNSALGTVEKFGPEVKPGARAVEVGASQLQNPALAYAFRIFGRPPRTSACDCERAMEPALPQRLYLMTDQTLLAKFNDPQGRLQVLLSGKQSDDAVLDELFLATLSRLPADRERKAFAGHLQTAANRRAAFTDTLWALINTREFILNH
jgi:hypothetical protein